MSQDCGYCPQAAAYHTGEGKRDLMTVSGKKAKALRAKKIWRSRVCGSSQRNVKDGPGI
jgi:biotin synthase